MPQRTRYFLLVINIDQSQFFCPQLTLLLTSCASLSFLSNGIIHPITQTFFSAAKLLTFSTLCKSLLNRLSSSSFVSRSHYRANFAVVIVLFQRISLFAPSFLLLLHPVRFITIFIATAISSVITRGATSTTL